MIILHKTLGGQRLDTPYSSRHAGLGYNLKCRDDACIFHMGSSTEFLGELSHAHYPDDVAVLLPKESRRAGLFRLFYRHVLRLYRQAEGNLLIYHILNLLNLLRRHSGKVCKVKPQPVLIDGRARLLHMIAENLPECPLQKMSRAVVVCRQPPLLCVNLKGHRIADFHHAFRHMPLMADLTSRQL